jgi:hypothetical protein
MRTATLLLTLGLFLGGPGCSAPEIHTTSLASTDLVSMTDLMTRSMLVSQEIATRNAQSPVWTVTLDRAINKTNSVIPQRELWAFMARLRTQLQQSPAMTQRNIRFVLSKETAEAVNAAQPDAAPGRGTPTHALAATFYSITSATNQARSDSYLCAYQLIDGASSQILWEDKYEIKRAVMRNVLD